MQTITRFAPSPTGFLHLGGARTALFNYVFARSKKGLFKTRNKTETTQSILDDLNWLGINFNGKIIYQSKNIKDHIDLANSLINKGLAYKCFHDESFLKEQKKNKKKIVSSWRDSNKPEPKNKPFCIRVKSPINGSTKINDKIQGKVEVNNSEIDDYIILRSDGTPTFLLSSAIDDFNMKITDIIRGDDHLTNSFRQKIIFDFIGYYPEFSHMSLIHNEKNEKLSKRINSHSINYFKNNGFLPSAIINYLMRMGWSSGNKEFFSLEEAIQCFKIKNVGKSPSKTDEKKLYFLNNFYIKKEKNLDLYYKINELANKEKQSFSELKKETVLLIEIFKTRSNTINELYNNLKFIIDSNLNLTTEEKKILIISKNFKNTIINELSSIRNWEDKVLENKLNKIIEKLDLSFKQIAQPLRLVIFRQINGPSIPSVLEILGKEEVLSRLNKFW